MPLNEVDQKNNYDKVVQVVNALTKFYDSPDSQIMLSRLDLAKNTLLLLLTYYETNLNAVNAFQLQNLFNTVITIENEEEANTKIEVWVKHQKKPVQPISDALHDFNAGSIKHFKTALHELIKTPEKANEKVVLLDPVSNISQSADAIKTVMNKSTTEKILVPLLCELNIVWRLLIIKVNKTKIEEATLWDTLGHKTDFLEDLKTTIQKLDPNINPKKIHFHYSSINAAKSAAHSFDFVVQYCVKLTLPSSQRNVFWKDFCSSNPPYLLRRKIMEILENPNLGKPTQYVTEGILLFGCFPRRVKRKVPQVNVPNLKEKERIDVIDVKEPAHNDLSQLFEQPRLNLNLTFSSKPMPKVNPSYTYQEGVTIEPIWYHPPN